MSNENEAKTYSKTTRQPRMCQVIADDQALYPDPLSMRAGETVKTSKKVDYWNGNPGWIWIWCTDSRGKSGWVPKGSIDVHTNDTTRVARYDYAATELTVAVGDELVVEQEESGCSSASLTRDLFTQVASRRTMTYLLRSSKQNSSETFSCTLVFMMSDGGYI